MKYPPILSAAQSEDAAVHLEHEFISIVREEIGMNEGLATLVAQAIVRGLRRKLGGQELWIPSPDKSQRDAAIRREFNGCNLQEIMTRHNLSRTRVYEIVGQRSGHRPPGSRSSPKNPALPLQTGHAKT